MRTVDILCVKNILTSRGNLLEKKKKKSYNFLEIWNLSEKILKQQHQILQNSHQLLQNTKKKKKTFKKSKETIDKHK